MFGSLRIPVGVLLLSALCGANAAPPADPCAVVPRASVESILGGSVQSAVLQDSRSQRICLMMVMVSDTPGSIRVGIFKTAPATPESGVTMQPLDKLVPVSGIGDEALVNTNAQEIKFRRGEVWYHISTHSAPCHGDTKSADDTLRRACAAKRSELMLALARSATGS